MKDRNAERCHLYILSMLCVLLYHNVQEVACINMAYLLREDTQVFSARRRDLALCCYVALRCQLTFQMRGRTGNALEKC